MSLNKTFSAKLTRKGQFLTRFYWHLQSTILLRTVDFNPENESSQDLFEKPTEVVIHKKCEKQ